MLGTKEITQALRLSTGYVGLQNKTKFYYTKINNYLTESYNYQSVESILNQVKDDYKQDNTKGIISRYKAIDNNNFYIFLGDYIKRGALLFEEVREYLTGETVDIDLGFKDNDGIIKNIHFNSLQEFFNTPNLVQPRIDYSTSTFQPTLKPNLQMTNIRNEIKQQSQRITNVISKERFKYYQDVIKGRQDGGKKVDKVNEGYLYEALRMLKEENPNSNLERLRKETIIAAWDKVNSNHASIQYGGDHGRSQIKYGRDAQIANLSTIKKALNNTKKILNDFFINNSFSQLENSIQNKLTKINFEDEMTTRARNKAIKDLDNHFKEVLGIPLKD